MERFNVVRLKQLKGCGKIFSMVTAYDAGQAHLASAAQIDCLLIGDSLGQVIQGKATTIPVTLAQMCYHTKCVASSSGDSLVVTDMPFGSYINSDMAAKSACRLMQAGAHMVKLEGDVSLVPILQKLTKLGIPTCAHFGLTPQFVHKFGGYCVQGKGEEQARSILDSAERAQEAGADFVLLECVPAELALRVQSALAIPVIGIGCKVAVDAQVLVWNDLLGMSSRAPSFAKNFLCETNSIQQALVNYHKQVVCAEFY